MIKLIKCFDFFTERLGHWVSWATLVLLLLTFSVVILRYLFNIGATGLQDTALYLHGAVFTLGASYTLKHDAHVRVDIFYRRFSVRARHWVDFIGTLCFLLPVSVFLCYWCFDYVLLSWQVKESSVEAGGLGLVYLQKSLLLALGICLILEGIVNLYRHGHSLFFKKVC